ncbi:TPA: ClpX C4-type zinc finger protein [Citrobacter farmeri]|nr:hypothetical protein [Citrobacter farmeri]
MSEKKCIFCDRRQEDVPLLFIDEKNTSSAICSTCVAKAANILMERSNAAYVKTYSFVDHQQQQ